jgi:tetratricopeptide (TPR) repeat protein
VRKLDALPLAIELAAARSRALSPQKIDARLSKRFHLLRGIRRGETDRHASLRGLIDWSWELLEPWEQEALAQLSVFRDGFLMEAAERVLNLSAWPDAPWALDVVAALLDKSLLYSVENGDHPRFRMYRSVQAYAKERLGDRARAPRVRHLFHFSALGSDARMERRFGEGRGELTRTLRAEQENLRAAMETALELSMTELGGRCGLAIAVARQDSGPFQDVIDLIVELLRRPISQGLAGRLHRRLGWLYFGSGQRDVAMDHYQEALRIFQSIGERSEEAYALGNIGNCLFRWGRVDEALDHYQRSMETHRDLGNLHAEAGMLGSLASGYEHKGYREKALQMHVRSLAVARALGSIASEEVRLANIGIFLEVGGRAEEAQAHYRASMKLAARMRNHMGVAVTMANLADSLRDTGQFEEARELYLESVRLRRAVGNRKKVGIALGGLGVLHFKSGRIEQAESTLREALELIDGSQGFAPGLFRAWLALIRAQDGAVAEARDMMNETEQQLQGFRPTLRGTHFCLRATVERIAGDRDAYEAALAAAVAVNDAGSLGETSKIMRMVGEVRADARRSRGWVQEHPSG